MDFNKTSGSIRGTAAPIIARARGSSSTKSRSTSIYTQAAFGFVGRSVYQRPLYPLKSFVQTMITDDLGGAKGRRPGPHAEVAGLDHRQRDVEDRRDQAPRY